MPEYNTSDPFVQELVHNEGFKIEPYRDTVGKMTGGIGHLFTQYDKDNFKTNWTKEEKETYWIDRFNEDLYKASKDVENLVRTFKVKPTKAQKEVLVDMRFNLGLTGLKGFKGMIGALSTGDIDTAADEMIDSQWHRDFVKWNSNKDTSRLRSRRLEAKMRGSK